MLTKFRDDETNKITVFGKISIGGVVVSAVVGAFSLVVETRYAELFRETEGFRFQVELEIKEPNYGAQSSAIMKEYFEKFIDAKGRARIPEGKTAEDVLQLIDITRTGIENDFITIDEMVLIDAKAVIAEQINDPDLAEIFVQPHVIVSIFTQEIPSEGAEWGERSDISFDIFKNEFDLVYRRNEKKLLLRSNWIDSASLDPGWRKTDRIRTVGDFLDANKVFYVAHDPTPCMFPASGQDEDVYFNECDGWQSSTFVQAARFEILGRVIDIRASETELLKPESYLTRYWVLH